MVGDPIAEDGHASDGIVLVSPLRGERLVGEGWHLRAGDVCSSLGKPADIHPDTGPDVTRLVSPGSPLHRQVPEMRSGSQRMHSLTGRSTGSVIAV